MLAITWRGTVRPGKTGAAVTADDGAADMRRGRCTQILDNDSVMVSKPGNDETAVVLTPLVTLPPGVSLVTLLP